MRSVEYEWSALILHTSLIVSSFPTAEYSGTIDVFGRLRQVDCCQASMGYIARLCLGKKFPQASRPKKK